MSSLPKIPEICELVVRIVAMAHGVSPAAVLHSERGEARTARSRQVCAYLLHTGLSMTLTETAEILGRHRSTIGHACRQVEDFRDDPAFDQTLKNLEETIALVRNGLVCKGNGSAHE